MNHMSFVKRCDRIMRGPYDNGGCKKFLKNEVLLSKMVIYTWINEQHSIKQLICISTVSQTF
jgi:hypothetical protein